MPGYFWITIRLRCCRRSLKTEAWHSLQPPRPGKQICKHFKISNPGHPSFKRRGNFYPITPFSCQPCPSPPLLIPPLPSSPPHLIPPSPHHLILLPVPPSLLILTPALYCQLILRYPAKSKDEGTCEPGICYKRDIIIDCTSSY